MDKIDTHHLCEMIKVNTTSKEANKNCVTPEKMQWKEDRVVSDTMTKNILTDFFSKRTKSKLGIF